MKCFCIASVVFVLCPALPGADNPLSGILGPESLKSAEASGVRVLPGERPDSVILKFAAQEKPDSLVLRLPAAARDWLAYRTLTFEFTSDSTINWDLVVRNPKGEISDTQVRAFVDVPVKAAIPIRLLC